MKVINNKYIIEKEISEDENYIEYLVKDTDKNIRYSLTILKNNSLSDKSKDYLLNQFNAVKNLNSIYTISVLKFEVIHILDGVKLEKYLYGFLCESTHGYVKLINYIKLISVKEKLDIFAEICAVINTLNTTGMFFESINLKDLFLYQDKDGNVHVKINNLLQNQLMQFNEMEFNQEEILYKEDSRQDLNRDNLNELAEIFSIIFKLQEIEEEFTSLIELKIDSAEFLALNNIHNISEFIKYINMTLKKNYSYFINESVNKIRENIDIIGREEEINLVERSYEALINKKIKRKIIAFKGDNGSGKSKLLEQIRYVLSNKYLDNLICISTNYENIIAERIKNKFKNIIDKYDIYIKNFLGMCQGKKSYDSVSENERLKLLNRITKLLNEFLQEKPVVIIIDRLNIQPQILIEFIQYLIFTEINLENFIIIFSFNEIECSQKFKKDIEEFEKKPEYEEYTLQFLNKYQTTKMIKSMLNTTRSLGKLDDKIYSETLGNPQYIKEVVKELYNDGILYFDTYDGIWKTTVDLKEIKIPKTLEKNLEETLESLNKKEVDILRRVAIFERLVSEEIILKHLIKTDEEKEIYKKLKEKGYLTEKISDQGIMIGFFNNLIRNILNLRNEKEKSIKLHNLAADILISNTDETDYYLEELIYHLEKLGRFDEMLEYSLKYAEKLESIMDYEKAAFYIKKCSKYTKGLQRIEFTTTLARLYKRTLNDKEAKKCFNLVKTYAADEGEEKIQLIAEMEIIINEIKTSQNFSFEIDEKITAIRQKLSMENNSAEEVYYYYIMILKYNKEENFKDAALYVEKAVSICRQNNIASEIYAWCLSAGTIVEYNIQEYEKALEFAEKAIFIFNELKNYNGVILTKITELTIQVDIGTQYEPLMESYEALEKMSFNLKLYKHTILILNNIGELQISRELYEEARKTFSKAILISRQHHVESYSVMLYSNLCIIDICEGNTYSFIKGYKIIEQIIRINNDNENNKFYVSFIRGFYNMLIYNYPKAKEYLKDLKNNSNSYYNQILSILNNDIMFLFNDYKSKKNISPHEIEKMCRKAEKQLDKLTGIMIKIKLKIIMILRLIRIGYKDCANKLFQKINNYPQSDEIESALVLIELEFKDKCLYEFLIKRGNELCNTAHNKDVCADLYRKMGIKYNEIDQFISAVNNFYESLFTYTKIINALPARDKTTYANKSSFLETYNIIIDAINESGTGKYQKFRVIEDAAELYEILDKISVQNMLANQKIYNVMKQNYEFITKNNINSILSVMQKFTSDIVENINLTIKYLASIIMADKAVLIIKNSENANTILCRFGTEKDEDIIISNINLESNDQLVMVNSKSANFNEISEIEFNGEIKGFIQIKIKDKSEYVGDENFGTVQLNFVSTHIINYVNEESAEKLREFIPFLKFLLEKYKLTINSILDKLTQVYNRKYFEEALKNIKEESLNNFKQFGILMFDIDNFKGINDKFGHQVGDEVLVKLAQEVKESVRPGDIIGRYGGEEFIVLLPKADEEISMDIAENIRKNVENAKILGDKRKVTISIGVTVNMKQKLDQKDLIARADQALYKAKREGKNKCILWNEECAMNNTNGFNSMTGIITGNINVDYNFFLIAKSIAEISKSKDTKENKLYNFVVKVMNIIESEAVAIFTVNRNKISEKLCKYRNKDGWQELKGFNEKLVEETIKSKKAVYKIDWENVYKQDGRTNWHSVCIIPVIYNNKVLSVIYAYVSLNQKEFTETDLNQLTFLSEIGIPIFL